MSGAVCLTLGDKLAVKPRGASFVDSLRLHTGGVEISTGLLASLRQHGLGTLDQQGSSVTAGPGEAP